MCVCKCVCWDLYWVWDRDCGWRMWVSLWQLESGVGVGSERFYHCPILCQTLTGILQIDLLQLIPTFLGGVWARFLLLHLPSPIPGPLSPCSVPPRRLVCMNCIDRLPFLGFPVGFGQQFSIDRKRSRRKAVNLLSGLFLWSCQELTVSLYQRAQDLSDDPLCKVTLSEF